MTAVNDKSLALRVLTDETRAKIDHWVTKYPEDQKRAALIPSLLAVQEQNGGWLSPELMDGLAEYLDLPKISVYEVATFYSMLELEPIGRHMVSICNNISCMLCGSDEIIAHMEKRFGVSLGDTTPDGKFTFKKEEECLAACTGGPMMTVDGHYYENLTPEKFDEILDSLE